MTFWIDTHCHLSGNLYADELATDLARVASRAADVGVMHCVLPAVERSGFSHTRSLAQRFGYSYALGIHPLYVKAALNSDLAALDVELTEQRQDPRLIAVGEIGLDFFVPELAQPPLLERQKQFYRAQLALAAKHELPVILHVRRSADGLLKALRDLQPARGWSGIVHAFNGSLQQAHAFIALGFKLGFGGALTYDRALQLRRLATQLPLSALVLETDSPDMPPHWLYTTAEQRAQGQKQAANEPAQLPRIAAVLAELRGISLHELAEANTANACAALPKLAALLAQQATIA